MDRRKYIFACLIAMFLGLSATGCGQEEKDLTESLERHKAVEMYRDGIWAPRYVSNGASGSGAENDSAQAVVSIDVKKEMTEDEMMEVVDYYTKQAAIAYDTGGGIDCTCYAAFYQGETDDELFRVKCLNGKKAEPAKEDSSIFPLPGMRTEMTGELP